MILSLEKIFHGIVYTYYVTHDAYITYMFSEKGNRFSCTSLGMRSLADTNRWNVNGQTSEVWGRCRRLLSQHTSGNVLAQPNVLLFSWVIENQSKVRNFLFLSLWQLSRRKYNVPSTAVKWRENVCRIKAFCENVGKFGQNILCTPKELFAPTPVCLRNVRWEQLVATVRMSRFPVRFYSIWKAMLEHCAK